VRPGGAVIVELSEPKGPLEPPMYFNWASAKVIKTSPRSYSSSVDSRTIPPLAPVSARRVTSATSLWALVCRVFRKDCRLEARAEVHHSQEREKQGTQQCHERRRELAAYTAKRHSGGILNMDGLGSPIYRAWAA
jgi:hypothetical protein